MRFMKLKRIAVSAMCGALLLTGSGVYNPMVRAEEQDGVYEDVTEEVEETDGVYEDVTEEIKESDIETAESFETDSENEAENEELEEYDSIKGITSAIDKARVSNPGTAGLLWLWTNDFYINKSVKKIKSGTYYNGDENTKYPGHAEYEYNDKGQLAKCTHSDNAGESNYREEFEYYPNGDLKSIKNYGGYKVTDINNASLAALEEFEYEYDSTGKCIKEKYYYTDYSDSAEEGKGKRYLWSTSTYEYDANGNCIKEYDDYYDVIKLYEYDAYGNCIKKSTQNEKGYIERVDEYNAEGYVIKEIHYDSNGNSTGGAVNDYKYEYDVDGDVVKITKTMHYLDDDTIFTAIFKYDYYPAGSYTGTITTSGIYCTSNHPSIDAGMVVQNSNANDIVEYRWVACESSNPEAWFEIQPWSKSEWIYWTPEKSGDYVLVCFARVVGDEDSEISASIGVNYRKNIKAICQMPYSGDGGGYLIGIESYENPNQAYMYEMLILDCNLYLQGKDAWVYTTEKCYVSEGNALWTVWQPIYGYYWTLFRLYDGNGNLIDEQCYGFANVF